MPKPALITSRDPKGLHAVGLFEAAYNKSKLDEARAQRLNERGGELQDGIAKLIAELTAELTDITPPQGGRTYDLSVTVDESRNWREAINTAGPDTSSNNNVWRVGDWYPTQNVNGTQQIVLVNFGKIMTSQGVLDWAKTNHLRPASPRVVFAVGEHQPKLDKTLGMNPMAIVSLQDCSFEGDRQVCDVWWCDSERKVNLNWLGGDWDGNDWFAFVRE